jgi:hypothetical protein
MRMEKDQDLGKKYLEKVTRPLELTPEDEEALAQLLEQKK